MFVNKSNARENRKGNQEWTIKRQWQHCAHKTSTNKTQNRTRTTQTIKKKSNTNLTTQPGVNHGVNQCAPKGQ